MKATWIRRIYLNWEIYIKYAIYTLRKQIYINRFEPENSRRNAGRVMPRIFLRF